MRQTILLLLTTLALTGCDAWSLITPYRNGDAVAAEQKTLFYGQDVLAAPGETVELAARIRRPRTFRGLENVLIAFDIGDRRLGEVTTDAHGHARLMFTVPSQPGDWTVTLTPIAAPDKLRKENRDVLQIRYDLLVAVREPDAKFLVVDLDHTIVDAGAVEVIAGEPPAMADSRDVLWRLTEREGFSLIYLTQRPAVLTRKSKLWLTANGFPPGVLVTSSRTKEAMGDTAAVKTRHLRELTARWPGIVIGIGDREGDVQAYLATGLRAYLIPDLGGEGKNGDEKRKRAMTMLRALPDDPNIQAVRSWLQIEQSITQGRHFSVMDFAAELEP